ncbi:LacI family transcriptional regulator [Ruminococcaceae bacterium OttesenSCG-928-A16]|nr:LacI family transcriptional regulator [Ruminococcaceae bacterium OttesenSCG-928-A16]
MRVTLSDIARRMGVTPSTVQRALNNMPGVSPEKRAAIQGVAHEMGYRRNFIASSLKKGAPKIALVLPEPDGANRYYATYLWAGVGNYLDGFTEFNFTIYKYRYPRVPGGLGPKLKQVLQEHGNELDGLLTMGTNEPEVLWALNELKAKNVPVVLVGTDAEESGRLCCVKTHDDMAGRMAADLLIQFYQPGPQSHVIITGDFTIPDQYSNAQGFEKQVLESGYPLEILKLNNHADLDVVKQNIKNVIASGLNVCAVYSCSARNTVPMCKAVQEVGEVGRQIRTIGSDIFPESIQYIRQNVLRAIIHKHPAAQAQAGMQTLVEYLLKDTLPQQDVRLVESVIAMKSNIECFV